MDAWVLGRDERWDGGWVEGCYVEMDAGVLERHAGER